MSFAAETQLGPYRIVSLIGSGGMGEVYRARDTRLLRDVALKVLPASFTNDPDRLRRFEQEARAVAALRETFEDDRVNRVPKGQNGADIHHHVRYKGQPCGLIVIDSKNHQGWSNSFVPKLREDQVAAGADHAILSTSAFPSGEKEMCIQSEVIIVNPARVAYVVELLRKALISMYVLGLSTKERSDTTDQLYKLITSDSYKGRFNEAVKVSEEILQLDVEEQKAHSTVWRNRGMLSKRMGNVLRGIDSDVSAIIERSSAEEGRETARPKLPPSVVSPATRRDAV